MIHFEIADDFFKEDTLMSGGLASSKSKKVLARLHIQDVTTEFLEGLSYDCSKEFFLCVENMTKGISIVQRKIQHELSLGTLVEAMNKELGKKYEVFYFQILKEDSKGFTEELNEMVGRMLDETADGIVIHQKKIATTIGKSQVHHVILFEIPDGLLANHPLLNLIKREVERLRIIAKPIPAN